MENSTIKITNKRILIADSNASELRNAADIFKGILRVSIAYSADNAKKEFDNSPPDIILIDPANEKFASFALDCCLDHPEIPVVIYSASSKNDNENYWLDNGAADFFFKPYKAAELYDVIIELLEDDWASNAELIASQKEALKVAVEQDDLEDIIIKLRGITKVYKSGTVETHALRGIDLDVHTGEFLVILGESGSGKTTLLNIIGGIDPATNGEYLYNGIDMTALDEKRLTRFRKDKVSFIFQSYNLLQDLTVRENVRLVTSLHKSEYSPEKALIAVGLTRKMYNYPSQLSGGEQQRVSIARAIAKQPEIILADEPTAALDRENGIEVLDILHSISRDENCTTIVITHNPEIARMADRVIRITSGRIVDAYINEKPVSAYDLRW